MLYCTKFEQPKDFEYLIKRISGLIPSILVPQLFKIIYNNKGNKEVLVKFMCQVCEKVVGTNHNAICCDMCDRFIAIRFAKKADIYLKKDQVPCFCKSSTPKELPFSSLNDTEFIKRMSVLLKRK